MRWSTSSSLPSRRSPARWMPDPRLVRIICSGAAAAVPGPVDLPGGGGALLFEPCLLLDDREVLIPLRGRDDTFGHGALQGATRRVAVRAVAETALLGEGVQFGVLMLGTFVLAFALAPHGGGPDPRRVDDGPSPRQRQELAMTGGVSALAATTDHSGLLGLCAEEQIGQCRFPRAR